MQSLDALAREAAKLVEGIPTIDVSDAARIPAASAARIWSCISAIKGEITSPVPSRASAGIW